MHDCVFRIPLSFEEYVFISKGREKSLCVSKECYYYYDTRDFQMSGNGIMYRVADSGKEYVASIIETNSGITRTKCQVVNGPKDISFFRRNDLEFKGLMHVDSVVLYNSDDIRIVADKNSYLGITEHELIVLCCSEKLENTLRYIENTLHMLAGLRQTWVRNHRSLMRLQRDKNERFFEKLRTDKFSCNAGNNQ